MTGSTMKCSKRGLFRIADVTFLAVVFLFQNVMLNYIIIYHHSASIFSFLWFLGDFFCLVFFSFTVFVAHSYHRKLKLREQRSASRASYTLGGERSSTPQGSEGSDDSGFMGMHQVFGGTKLPLTYVAWLVYAILLIMKITVLFKSNISQRLPKDEILGPQMLKFCIGLSTIVFSLLVESHHNAVDEPLRNSYLNSVAFGVALEILDSVSFLSLLIPSEGHMSYSYSMENYIIALAAINIMLPAVTIYKLSASNFGRVYNVPLEALYKFLHLILVNLPFLCFRLYLWQFFSTDSAIFMIKNLYAIIAFVRGIYPDIKLLRQIVQQRIQLINMPASTSPKKQQSNGKVTPPGSKLGGSSGNVSPELQVVYRNERSPSNSYTAHVPIPTSARKTVFPSVSIEETNEVK